MAYVSQIKDLNNNIYDIKDSNCVKATSSSLGLVKPDNSTITIAADGTISSSGGGGGMTGTPVTVSIAATDWSGNTCTKSVNGVTSSNTVIVSFAPENKTAWTKADIYCSAQGPNTLTFTCTSTPTATIRANVLILDGLQAQMITFFIDTTGETEAYNAEDGMTWAQWADSTYNTAGYYILDGYVYNAAGVFHLDGQTPSSVIVNGTTYRLTGGGGND